ncbi:efflux RND transporter periplasmic adaptor subunit [Acuticoccus sp. M5D2P5]|uniref:efflux RND transporter periplasmic adaptor subunit n=1 Tax=Acuticoccus kalidii TaxID=2910977 RepID=UPI001F4101AD|nr:efflux RND transporter periplasmic adaptor subunit [Acuticoccus kalidii]MCF3933687.1 efflux RND transporter periplasmic adaptor subunit [Acuticoccus kalidii]
MGLVRQIVILATLVVLVGGGYVLYRDHSNPGASEPQATASGSAGAAPSAEARSVAVEVEIAALDTIDISVEAVGTTRALQSVDIVPLAEGRIVELDIAPGKEVAAGDVLARLDIEIEEATLREAEALLDEKRSALERSESLLRNNSSTVSRATLDQLRSEQLVAEATVQRARRRADDRTVRAPFGGVLGIGSVDLGARVDTSTVLTTLDDLSEVEIEFRLPETVYGQIVHGQRVAATSAAFPDRVFTGTVIGVDSRIEPASRAFRVRARIPNADRALPAGMFMRIDLALRDRQNVTVPEEAVTVEGGGTFVYVVVDDKAEQRPIAMGVRRHGMVEVMEGVAPGDVVISRGVQSLRDGAPVRILNEPEETSAPAAANATDEREERRS